MPKKSRWPKTHHVDIPIGAWKGIDRVKYSEAKRQAFDLGDRLAPLETFVINHICGDAVPQWVNDYIAMCFYKVLTGKGKTKLNAVFGLTNNRHWKQREEADRYRELTGEMYKLIRVGINRSKAARAIAAKRTDSPAAETLEQMYYRDGWAKLWSRHFGDDDAQKIIECEKESLLQRYGL